MSKINEKVKRGLFIVLEGIDCSGKSTQTRLISEGIKNKFNLVNEIMVFPEMEKSLTGNILNKYLNKEKDIDKNVLHLLFSANRWELKKEMETKLDNGITLIVDRYVYSGVVYSKTFSSLDWEYCKAPDSGLILPDLVIFLDISPLDVAKRHNFGTQRYENINCLTRVNNNYLKLKEEEGNWLSIDALLSKDVITNTILNYIPKILKCQLFPILYINWL